MKKEIYRSKFEAYPFLSDASDDLRCDFEIFTDEISSQIGLLRSKILDESLRSELLKICELVYHMNPSLRTFVSVTEEELKWLEDCTNRLFEEVKERCEKFVLNQGCESACQAHILRTKFKALVRMLYRYNYGEHEVPNILFDFANLLSGYFFNLALKLNQINNVDEIEFLSRNYK
ncbi:ATP--cob(I)alamin adenosyltransferase [Tissierella sp. Yu-01]|uniref:ATP:cob(I)alamin adenosyltransferase n=1 Tax=Tissierella sp. Yu-01 TaxID=3035694 RepID=UPI00240D4D62|nr:ATP--cob(I)alamin adenosyltransferase [Tissierella sp. Yu-01]WFA08877.1 ATP--cob(I)alamin adenosyltransferase [Tissierella sp. Yu-01]